MPPTSLRVCAPVSDVDPQLQEYLLQELETGISEHGNMRQSSVETIIRITDQSAAALQAREVLGDPWVIQRYRELRQRRVTADSWPVHVTAVYAPRHSGIFLLQIE